MTVTLHEDRYTIFDLISLNTSKNEKYFGQKILRKSKSTFYAQ